jgi:hypothetical protein
MYADSDATRDQFFPSEVITDNNPKIRVVGVFKRGQTFRKTIKIALPPP